MSVPVLSWSFYAGSNQAPRAALRQRAGWIPRLEAAVSGRRQPGRLRSPASSSAAISGRSARGHSPPDPQSQSFSRSYGSILPTSLIYILLWTRGYTPWRPDAVMSTPGGANTTRCSNFHGPSAAHQTRGKPACFTSASAPSPGKPIPGPGGPLLTRKDNSPRDRLRRLRARLRCRASTSRPRNINRVPFR